MRQPNEEEPAAQPTKKKKSRGARKNKKPQQQDESFNPYFNFNDVFGDPFAHLMAPKQEVIPEPQQQHTPNQDQPEPSQPVDDYQPPQEINAQLLQQMFQYKKRIAQQDRNEEEKVSSVYTIIDIK
jgi:hypothetical protein